MRSSKRSGSRSTSRSAAAERCTRSTTCRSRSPNARSWGSSARAGPASRRSAARWSGYIRRPRARYGSSASRCRRATRPADFRRHAANMQMIFQDPYSSLNPRMTVGEIIGEGLRLAGGHGRTQVRAAVADWLVTRRARAGSRVALPARVLGRAAAARRHRARADPEAAVRRVRRADLRARRFGASADREAARRAEGFARPHVAVHRARSFDGALCVGPHGRDVSRLAGRDRYGRRRLLPAEASVHRRS